MNSINHPDIGRSRLWAVARKEGLQRFHRDRDAAPRVARLRKRAAAPGAGKWTSGVELELAARHFEDQRFDPAEAERLSAAILGVVRHGGTRVEGPMGRCNRRYQLCRQTDGLSVRAGEGRILLSLTSAVRLAGLLRTNPGPSRRPLTPAENAGALRRGQA